MHSAAYLPKEPHAKHLSQQLIYHTLVAVAQETSGVLRRQPGELPLVFIHAHYPVPEVSKAGRRHRSHRSAPHDPYSETLAYHDLSTTYARGVKLFLALLEGCAYRKPFSFLSDPLATKRTSPIDFAPSGDATIRLGLLRLSLGPPERRRLLPRLSCLRHPPAPLRACR